MGKQGCILGCWIYLERFACSSLLGKSAWKAVWTGHGHLSDKDRRQVKKRPREKLNQTESEKTKPCNVKTWNSLHLSRPWTQKHQEQQVIFCPGLYFRQSNPCTILTAPWWQVERNHKDTAFNGSIKSNVNNRPYPCFSRMRYSSLES